MDTAHTRPEDGASESSVRSTGMRAGWVDGAWTTVTRTSATVVDTATELSISPRVQYGIYAALFLIGLGMRLVRLGDQAVHHDESLHGYFGYQIAIGNEYEHSPLTHGMFLFELIAAMFFLFGDSEFTLRLGMVLFGSALILVPLLLRKQLGDVGAILTSVMLTFSPALFYFSRFARNDILMALFIALLVVAMWRYIEEQRHRWLYIAAAVLGFSMATKETAYIFVVIFAAYFAWATRYELRDILLGHMKLNEISPQGHILVLLVGLTAPFYVAGIALFQDLFGLTLAAVEGTPNVATGAPDGSTAIAVAAVLTLLVFGVGIAIGAWWNWRRFWVALAIFWAIYAVIMTNFGSHYPGVITGVWQSLGYWLAQQDVRRGDQPWYYYFIMGSVYEFLPMLSAVGIALYYAIRTGWRSIGLIAISVISFAISTTLLYTQYYQKPDPPSELLILPFLALAFVTLIVIPLTLNTSRFMRFLLFWAFGTFLALSVAGEKMPWLLAQLTVPFIFVAGHGLGILTNHVDWHYVWQRKGWIVFALAPLALVAIYRLIFFEFYDNFDISNSRDLSQFFELWALIAFCGVGLLLLIQSGLSQGFRTVLSVIAVALVAVMFAFTLRASFNAVYKHGDVPREMLVYTQTTPDLHETAKEIDLARDLAWNKSEFSLAIDTRDGFAWPWSWYLRDYEGVGYIDLEGEGATVGDDRTIAVINARNHDKVKESLPERFDEGRHMIHRWWFPEVYKEKTPGDVWNGLTNRELLRPIADFWFHRKLSTDIGYIDSYVYYRDDTPSAPLR
ncbi:MAG: TIGR03663 family protein [Chloroflexi bacterium]|nr:TIGR03663 family protein [Chloroflexota bacterium]MYF78465.1 TIGR03663 family protein [Chloroflexota bacterium]MYK61610.1 TIGR03663 family protein [Chloroflexota bacterium]